ncbi:MAG: hypothetical protein PHV13_03185 [Candidatus ainarchaeum sp.]|nr:hypothetical protein [Candidatus ainarchaeum sp.]
MKKRSAKASQPAEKKPEAPTRTVFSFELLKTYPEARFFMIKKPLKGSMKDTVFELLGNKR